MLSPSGITFRLKQEAANLFLLATRPGLRAPAQPRPLALLPDPLPVAAALRSSPFAREIVRLADSILGHRIPLLAHTVDTGPRIDWRRDYVHHVSTPPVYFRRIPYLDFARAGDHKVVWEMNRHQHMLLLAQAWLLTSDDRYLARIVSHLESWWEQNHFQRGINWASALEVAFRAISWIWVFHWTGHTMTPGFRSRLLEELYRHGLHLEFNLSVYFSPNTHLLGEAVALHALGVLFPGWPRSSGWRRLGRKHILEQMDRQVLADGFHFELSPYYHLYALDMFVFHHLLEPLPCPRLATLRAMADCLDLVAGPARRLPALGDDDGGRFFHPYGRRERFCRATLATCALLFPGAQWRFDPGDLAEQAAWWLGAQALDQVPGPPCARASRLLPSAGLAVMTSGDLHVLADAGPFGEGNAGHSHADTLSVTARRGDEEILIDAGTFTYVSDPGWRDWFRGTAAHNTIRIAGLDQAVAAGPFRWTQKPAAAVPAWTSNPESDYLAASCSYRGFTHRRRVWLLKSEELLVVCDEIAGPPGGHELEQFWHLATAAAAVRLSLAGAGPPEHSEGGEHGWRSTVFGSKEPAPVICLRRTGALPAVLAAALDLSSAPQPASLTLEPGGVLRWRRGAREFRLPIKENR